MIIRNEKDKNYTVMSNYNFNNTNLSLSAKGLLSLTLSFAKRLEFFYKWIR